MVIAILAHMTHFMKTVDTINTLPKELYNKVKMDLQSPENQSLKTKYFRKGHNLR